jgi:hypothetical protein
VISLLGCSYLGLMGLTSYLAARRRRSGLNVS